jgi:hypothetical protein
MTRKNAARLLALCLPLLGGSASYAQGRFSQAAPISGSQFFSALKEVSVDLRSDPSLAKFIPLAEQQDDIAKALAGYGIAVRPNAQVALVVTVTHHDPTIESRIVSTGQVGDSTVVHGIYILTEFFLKTAALRNGKLHPVMAAPALSWSASEQAEDTSLRKLLLGDQTRQDIRNRFVRIFADCLDGIVKDTDNPGTPWFVDSWTEEAKAAADADYVKLMRPGTPIDKNPMEGLSSAPQISLLPDFNGLQDDCKADPGWNDAWSRVFQRLGWTGSQPPRLDLSHIFTCSYAFGLAAPRYYALSDLIYLLQSDLVFELNGKPVRKWGVLYLTHHETFALEDTVKERSAEFIPRNIQDFLTDLVLGNGPGTGPIPSGTQSSSGGAAQGPGTTQPSADARPPVSPVAPPPSVAPALQRPHPAPLMVGKADVSHLAGLLWGDAPAYVASIFGPPVADRAQDSTGFSGYPHTRGDGLSIRVNYDDDAVSSVKAYSKGSGVAADPVLDLLGKSEADAIALLGPPGTRESLWTIDKTDFVWSFPVPGRPADPRPNPEGIGTLTLHFRTGVGFESVAVVW